jgi:hypothetical protein
MQSLFLRSVAIVQFYRWYCGEITKSSAVVRCWHLSEVVVLMRDVRSWGKTGSGQRWGEPTRLTRTGDSRSATEIKVRTQPIWL